MPDRATCLPHRPDGSLPLASRFVGARSVASVLSATGWHRQSSLRNAGPPSRRDRRLHRAHMAAAVAAYMALYIVAVALSLPGALFLTITGGFLFGALVGGRRGDCRRDGRRDLIFLIAQSAVGEHLAAPRRAAGREARRRVSRRCVQLSAVPAVGADVSVLAGQSRAGAVRRPAADLRRARPCIGIMPATFAFAFVGAGLDSVDRGAGGRLPGLPCRRTDRLPARFRPRRSR